MQHRPAAGRQLSVVVSPRHLQPDRNRPALAARQIRALVVVGGESFVERESARHARPPTAVAVETMICWPVVVPEPWVGRAEMSSKMRSSARSETAVPVYRAPPERRKSRTHTGLGWRPRQDSNLRPAV